MSELIGFVDSTVSGTQTDFLIHQPNLIPPRVQKVIHVGAPFRMEIIFTENGIMVNKRDTAREMFNGLAAMNTQKIEIQVDWVQKLLALKKEEEKIANQLEEFKRSTKF